jgi:hypothetical protein
MGLVLALICVNAFLSLAEYSLITVRKTRIRQLVEEGNRAAILVEKLLKQPTSMQSTIQTGLTLVSTLAAIVAAVSAIGPLASWIAQHSAGFVHDNATLLALILVALPVTIVSLVIGEIAPKSLAIRHSERLALVAVYPVYGLKYLLTPLVALLTFLSNILVRPFGGTASFIIPAVNEEELGEGFPGSRGDGDDPLHPRLRRHRRAQGDDAAHRHDRAGRLRAAAGTAAMYHRIRPFAYPRLRRGSGQHRRHRACQRPAVSAA